MNGLRKILIAGAVLLANGVTGGWCAMAQGLDGVWTGKLELGGGRSLKLVLHVSEADNSVLMDSPEQSAYGLTGENVSLRNDSLSFEIPNLRMSYSGTRKENLITGTFRQNGFSLPLSFEPGEVKPERPQTPQPPFPYTQEEVRIENKAANATLAGTLICPENCTTSTPVVVLVTGSGLQNRDEEVFEHKPFAVIADYLARNGIASLRYDDRGYGESTGEVLTATTADFAQDAQAGVEWLRRQGRFGKVGIIGHSEGGQIAYMLGAAGETDRTDGTTGATNASPGAPDYIISIAGPSVKGTKTIAYQNRTALQRSGTPEKYLDDMQKAVEQVFEYKLKNPDITSISDEVMTGLYPGWDEDMVTRQFTAMLRQSVMEKPSNDWMVWFLNYDPAEDMRRLKIPALIIYGEKDTQVPPSLNSEPARRALPAAQIKTYPGLNHLMQHATTGYSDEYATIPETISPEVLADIRNFILAR